MSAKTQNQSTDFLVSNANGDVVVTNNLGVTISAAGESILLKQKLSDGSYRPTSVIKPNDVRYVSKLVVPSNVAPKYETFKLVAGSTGDLFKCGITIDGWGSFSVEDQDLNVGEVEQTATVNTAAELALEMVKSLAANYSKYEFANKRKTYVPTGGVLTYATEAAALADKASLTDDEDIIFITANATAYQVDDKTASSFATLVKSAIDWSLVTSKTLVWVNPLFNFYNGDGGEVYIVEKKQNFVTGKIDLKPITFNSHVKVFDYTDNAYDVTYLTVTSGGGVQNPLAAERVRQLEYHCMGNYGDLYDGGGWPYNRDRNYLSDLSNTYLTSYIIQIGTLGQGGNYGVESQATIQVVCDTLGETSSSDAKALEDALETALGITLPIGGGIVNLK